MRELEIFEDLKTTQDDLLAEMRETLLRSVGERGLIPGRVSYSVSKVRDGWVRISCHCPVQEQDA